MLRDRSAIVQNPGVLDWDDLRYFLAVADTGSTLSAGRVLKVSQTTAARRIAGLEQALALTLFDRRPSGYALTAAGEALLPQARAMAEAAERVGNLADAYRREVTGVVRLTTVDIFAVTILQPILRDLHAAHPAIGLELDTSDARRDLSAEADVALRMCDRPEGAGLVARRIAHARWSVYCSRAYAAEHGRPTRRAELGAHAFVGGGDEGVWAVYRAWLAANGLEKSVVMRHGSASGLLAAARAGMGLVVLPCLVADQEPDLLRCLPPAREAPHGLWLLTHERLRHAPRIRVVLDMLADRLGALARAAPD